MFRSYNFGKPLGKGKFGTTCLIINKATGEQLACKSITKHKLLTHQELSRDIQIMQRLAGHPNIVQLRSVHEDQQSVHLVMDLCQGGELIDRILQRKRFAESDAATIMRTIIEVSLLFM
jgi:calcium-dependent protein kinase